MNNEKNVIKKCIVKYENKICKINAKIITIFQVRLTKID